MKLGLLSVVGTRLAQAREPPARALGWQPRSPGPCACKKSERWLEAGPWRAGLPGCGLPTCCPFLKQTSGRGLGSGAELGGSAAIDLMLGLAWAPAVARDLPPTELCRRHSANSQTPLDAPSGAPAQKTLTAICPRGFSGDACGEEGTPRPTSVLAPPRPPQPGPHSRPDASLHGPRQLAAALPAPTWFLTSGPPVPLRRAHMESGVCPAPGLLPLPTGRSRSPTQASGRGCA